MFKLSVVALLAFGFSTYSNAYTQCKDLEITLILNDSKHTYVSLDDNANVLNGYIDRNSIQYKELVSIALAARSTSSKTVWVRYVDDGLDCSNLPKYDTKIQALGF